MIDPLPFPEGEPFPGETLIADGWVYRDMPGWMATEYWDQFLALLGEGNYRILAMSKRPDAKRGQFLISPLGMKNIAAQEKTCTMPDL